MGRRLGDVGWEGDLVEGASAFVEGAGVAVAVEAQVVVERGMDEAQ